MKELLAKNKNGQALVEKCNKSEGTRLSDVYSTWSRQKEYAMQYCLSRCEREEGTNFRIVSHNTFSFVVAWNLKNGDLRVETPSNSYWVHLS